MTRGAAVYRWLYLVLPGYAAFAFGRSSWPLAAALGLAIVLYNVLLTLAERRWPEWVRARTLFLRVVDIGFACIALSLIYLKGEYATLFEFYYDGFYAVPVIFAAAAAGRRGLFWSVLAATAAVAFGQVLATPLPGDLWGAAAADYWSTVAVYSAIYTVFFSTVGGLALFVREYGSREQRDLVLRLATSFTGLRDAVVIADPAGRVMSMNRAAEALFGQRVYQVFSRPIDELCPGLRIVDDLGRGPDSADPRDLWIRRGDRQEVPCEVTVSAYRVEGITAAYVLVIRDISGRLRIERELAQQNRLATVGRMTSGIAHDVENPLTAIKALADVMLMDERPSEEREALGTIRHEVDRVAAMLRDLLQFTRADSAPRAIVEVNEIVCRALKLRSYASRCDRVAVHCDLASPSPRALVNAGQLEQVVLNLITNGEQAMAARGGGELIIRTRRADDRVVIEVEDSGPGIPPDFIERIFDPFFTTKPPGEGTGLGLSIARDILRDHGGEVHVRNRPGRGACFVVEFPAVQPGDRLEPVDTEPPELRAVG